jgi:hypothetical protein
MKVLIGAVIALAMVAGGAFWMHSQGRLNFDPVSRQPTGDPPVTISDGSLHVKSRAGWIDTPGDNMYNTLNVYSTLYAFPELVGHPGTAGDPNAGQLKKSDYCGVKDSGNNLLPAALWTDEEKTISIDPGTWITIVHDRGDSAGNKPNVLIKLPAAAGPLTISTDDGNFAAEDPTSNGSNGRHNRRHTRPGPVESISVSTDQGSTWKQIFPASGTLGPHRHFTLEFCYLQ